MKPKRSIQIIPKAHSYRIFHIESETPVPELELSKVVAIDTKKEMIHLDKMTDGSWRLTYSESVIPDISKVGGFMIRR